MKNKLNKKSISCFDISKIINRDIQSKKKYDKNGKRIKH